MSSHDACALPSRAGRAVGVARVCALPLAIALRTAAVRFPSRSFPIPSAVAVFRQRSTEAPILYLDALRGHTREVCEPDVAVAALRSANWLFWLPSRPLASTARVASAALVPRVATTARVHRTHGHSDRRLDATIIFTLRGEEARVPIQDDTQGLSLCGNKLLPRSARLRADSHSRPAESQGPRDLRQRSRRRAPQRLPAGRQDQRVSLCPRSPCSAERSLRSR